MKEKMDGTKYRDVLDKYKDIETFETGKEVTQHCNGLRRNGSVISPSPDSCVTQKLIGCVDTSCVSPTRRI